MGSNQKRKIPVPNSPISRKVPIPSNPGKPKTWAFSFRFWQQIEYFGVGGRPNSWFVSLLERLADLSKEPIDDLIANRARMDALHYHKINWEQQSIPIQRQELHWVAKEYLNNSDDYPMVQVSISAALGRIIGFWDEQGIFNVILLDPMHNMQPVKRFDYRVQSTPIGKSQYADLREQIERLQHESCADTACKLRNAALRLPHGEVHGHDLVILRVSNESLQYAHELIRAKKTDMLCDIFELGILTAADRPNSTSNE